MTSMASLEEKFDTAEYVTLKNLCQDKTKVKRHKQIRKISISATVTKQSIK